MSSVTHTRAQWLLLIGQSATCVLEKVLYQEKQSLCVSKEQENIYTSVLMDV